MGLGINNDSSLANAGTLNRTETCYRKKSLKITPEDACMCKQTSRILFILSVLGTLEVLLFICPWIHHTLYSVKLLKMNYL